MNRVQLFSVGIASVLMCSGCLGLFDTPTQSQVPKFSSDIIMPCDESAAGGGIHTSDNSILLVGAYGEDFSELFIEKLSETGKLLWKRNIDSLTYWNNHLELGRMVLQSRDGGYLISGATDYSTFLKVDSLGEYQWKIDLSRYQPPTDLYGPWNDFIKAIVNGPGDEVLALGIYDRYIRQIHLDPLGTVTKIDTADIPGFRTGRAQYSQDGFWVVGITDSAEAGVDTLHYFTVLKFDFAGNLKLRSDVSIQKDFPEAYRNVYEMSFSFFAPSPDGGIVAYGVGSERRTAGGYTTSERLDPIMIRLDGKLTLVSAKTYSFTDDKTPRALYMTSSGEYLIIGSKKSGSHGEDDGYIEKYGATWTPLWQKDYGGPSWDFFSNAFALPDHRIMVLGGTNSYGPSCQGSEYPFVLELDEDGNLVNNH